MSSGKLSRLWMGHAGVDETEGVENPLLPPLHPPPLEPPPSMYESDEYDSPPPELPPLLPLHE